MKISIIYASWFNNGKKAVEELAELLKKKGHDVIIYSANSGLSLKIQPSDFYIFSSPTRKFSLPAEIKKVLSDFYPYREGEKYALITTYMDPRTIALKKMDAILAKKKMVKSANDLKIKIKGLKGPLEENYADMVNKFAEDICSSLS